MNAIDWSALKENCGGDDGLVAEVLDLFIREAPALLGDVRSAVASHEALAVKRTAHRLKGALVSLAAQPAVAYARELEELGAASRLDGAADAFARLESEMGKLLVAVGTRSKAA
jgi:HPt (histidine-containing phosphotransfer) domain-containing protein